MKKLTLALLAALALSGTARADRHYWISPTGNNANLGDDPSRPWQTMAYFNANAVQPKTANGWVYLHLMSHSGSPWDANAQPANVPIDGKYYVIVGDSTWTGPGWQANPTNLDNYELPGGSGSNALTKTYIEFRGVKFTGSLDIGKDGNDEAGTAGSLATGTRLVDCILNADLQLVGARDVRVLRSRIQGPFFHLGQIHGDFPNQYSNWQNGTISNTRRDTIESCFFTALGENQTYHDSHPIFRLNFVDSSLVRFNRVSMHEVGTAGALGMFKAFNIRHLRFKYNRWVLRNDGYEGEDGEYWIIRNSARNYHFTGDSMFVTGRPADLWFLEHVSTADSTGVSYDWGLDSCFVYNPVGHAIELYGFGPDSVQISYSVIAALKQPILWRASSEFDGKSRHGFNLIHNTFIGNGHGGLVGPGDGTSGAFPELVRDPMWRMRDNVFVATGLGAIEDCNYDPCDCYWLPGVSVYIDNRWSTATTQFSNNFHALYSYDTTPGDKVYAWQYNGRNCVGVDTLAQIAAGFPCLDRFSLYGDARLASGHGQIADSYTPDPVFGLPTNFDPRLLSNSLARGAGTGGSDIGAIAFSSGGPHLQITVAESLKVATWPPDSIGMMNFVFRNTGNATLNIDTLYTYTRHGQWDAAGGHGTIGTLAITQTQIAPGSNYSFSVPFHTPAGSVHYQDIAGFGGSGYSKSPSPDSVFTFDVDTTTTSPWQVNYPYGIQRLVMVMQASTPSDSIYRMTLGGTNCTKFARYADVTAGTSTEYWLSPELTASFHNSLVVRYTHGAGVEHVTFDHVPCGPLRSTLQFEGGGFLADSTTSSTITAPTTGTELVIASGTVTSNAELLTIESPFRPIGGLFGPIGDSGPWGYSLSTAAGSIGGTAITYTGSSASHALKSFVMLRYANTPAGTPNIDGVVFDTNDPAYDSTTDPTSAPGANGPHIGINFWWPWSPAP